MTTGGYEAAEDQERLRITILEAARARTLAKASQVATAAAIKKGKPLILMAPGRYPPSHPMWDLYRANQWSWWVDYANMLGFTPAAVVAQGVASDPASQQALEQVAVRVRETGVRGDSSQMLLLLVVLIWLIAVGFPMVQAELPGKAQEIAINEVATVGLALAITWRVLDKRNKND